MSYTSLTFVVFLLATGILYYVFPKRARWAVLLTGSYLFYFLSSKWLAGFLLLTTGIVYGTALWLGAINDRFQLVKSGLDKERRKVLKQKTNRRKRSVMLLGVLSIFSILAFLKYFNFLGSTVNSVLDIFHVPGTVPRLNLALPLGISYYTLQAAGYVIDVYRGACKPDRNLGRVALFLSFFPQIIEGPIGRYGQLAHQLYAPHALDYTNVTRGLQRALWGLFKKMVIADRAGILVNEVFANSTQYGGIVALLAVVLYTLQIYMDFCGSMDVVCGVAEIFGIHLAENFRRPFFSRSIQEFWRRWHITLGTWLKDYIFYPVSLSRAFAGINKFARAHWKGNLSKVLPVGFALFFVWFGNGIWHGASWKYVCYGLYYYAIMMVGKFCEPLSAKLIAALHIHTENRAYHIWQMLRTALFVLFGMLLFRSESLSAAFAMFGSVFSGFSLNVLTDGTMLGLGIHGGDYLILALSTLLVFGVSLAQERGVSIRSTIAKKNIVVRWVIYFTLLFLIIIFGIYGEGYHVNTFIYGQF